jgi:parallel beta-helix repeat protein
MDINIEFQMKMFRKTVSGVMLTLLLIGMLTLVLNIQPVKASGTIFIRPDGSIDPPTAPISSVDKNTYAFTDDISDEIVVQRSNIIIDGAGFTLQGTGALNSTGIYLSGVSNVVIKKTNIVGFFSGIKLNRTKNNAITENKMTNNDFSIWLHDSTDNTISGNYIESSWSGINIAWSTDNSISENNVTNSEYGILLHWSANNVLSGNDVANNGCSISLAWSANNVITKNNIANNVKGGWYGIRLHSSANNAITENNMTNSVYGIGLLYDSANNVITGNNITNNFYGITLWYSSKNTIHHNNFVNKTNQVKSYASINTWDDGYPSGGNYWSDYSGADEKSGAGQDQLGSDGIGDTPYIIDADNRDRYPNMRQVQQPTLPINSALFYALLIVAIVVLAGAVFFVIRKRKPQPSL